MNKRKIAKELMRCQGQIISRYIIPHDINEISHAKDIEYCAKYPTSLMNR